MKKIPFTDPFDKHLQELKIHKNSNKYIVDAFRLNHGENLVGYMVLIREKNHYRVRYYIDINNEYYLYTLEYRGRLVYNDKHIRDAIGSISQITVWDSR